MHVMVRVKNLSGSTRFYSELFGAEPTVSQDDYAKWMLDDPRVNFSIATARADGAGFGVEHLGIQAESPEELETLRERIGRAGGTVKHEGQTTCCYANSDKTWVVDAQGVAWEAFYTSGDADTYYSEDARGACCEDDCCEGSESPAARDGEVSCCEVVA
ncbi:MAG: VOC family protein [Thermoanaerobaculia bacterium]|nr:VOC family protein [Thermoanaerobaculia bacterium]